VVMYSINVFLTFSLTELGMSRYWLKNRQDPRWKTQLAIQGTGLVMCVGILGITLYEKFTEGGWVTAVITSLTIALCFVIRRHYHDVRDNLKRLDAIMEVIPVAAPTGIPKALDPAAPTAIVSVGRYSGFGIHQLLSIQKLLPNYFKNFIFVSVGVLDSGNFKGSEEMERLESSIHHDLEKYVAWSRSQGLNADYRMTLGTEAIEPLEDVCKALAKEFPRMIVFAGKLIFKNETWTQRILHNETAADLQRRLQFDGIQTIILPIRLL
jgi:hypothetical protein